MKKLFATLLIMFTVSFCFAKQRCEYYRYNFSINVASDAKKTLDELISKGKKIISFSLDYQQKCMVVVFEE